MQLEYRQAWPGRKLVGNSLVVVMMANMTKIDMSLDTRLSYQRSQMQIDDESDTDGNGGGHDYNDTLGVGDEGEFHSHSGNEIVIEDDGDMDWEDILPHR
jgi:hypothetical protein